MKLGILELPIALIDDKESIQSRVELNVETVAQYAADMKAGDQFPPIDVFFDGHIYRLADGFHRYTAVIDQNGKSILADVKEGGRFEALIHALRANRIHGLRISNRDKHHRVQLALGEAKCAAWSDREIADVCGVSHTFISSIRRPKPPTSGNGCQPQPYESGNRAASLPDSSRPAAPASHRRPLPAFVPKPFILPPPNAEDDAVVALETRIENLPDDIASASPRARQAAVAALKRVLPRLSSLVGRHAL